MRKERRQFVKGKERHDAKLRDEFFGIVSRNFYDNNTARSLSIKAHLTAPLVKVTCAKILPLPERTLATSLGLGAVITWALKVSCIRATRFRISSFRWRLYSSGLGISMTGIRVNSGTKVLLIARSSDSFFACNFLSSTPAARYLLIISSSGSASPSMTRRYRLRKRSDSIIWARVSFS